MEKDMEDLDALAALLADDDDISADIDCELTQVSEDKNEKAEAEEDPLAFLEEEFSDDEEEEESQPTPSLDTSSEAEQMAARIKQLEALLKTSGVEVPADIATSVSSDPKTTTTKPTKSVHKQKTTPDKPSKKQQFSKPTENIPKPSIQFGQAIQNKQRIAHVPKQDNSKTVPKPDKGKGAPRQDNGKAVKLPDNGKVVPKSDNGKRVQRPEKGTIKSTHPRESGTKRKADNVLENGNKKLAMFEDESDIFTDSFSGLRIVKPLISSDTMAKRMEGRKFVKVNMIDKLAAKGDVQGDWVTVGVLVQKSEAKSGSNGNTFSVWKLSSLNFVGDSKTQALFLFGNIFKEHWKTTVGSVIGLLNPTIMPPKEKNSKEVALSLDNPRKLMIMGLSKDFGHCKSTRKSDGKPCGNFINRLYGEHCEYHVQTAYKKMRSKRAECQAGYGAPSKAPLMNKLMNDMSSSTYIYNGKSLSADMFTGHRPAEKVSLKQLTSNGSTALAAASKAGVYTSPALFKNNRAQELNKRDDPVPEKKQKKDSASANTESMLELLDLPTVGSLNLIKHLHKNEVTAKPEVYKSRSASDLLKDHKRTLSSPSTSKVKKDPASMVPMLGRGLDASSNLFFSKPAVMSNQDKKSAAAKMKAVALLKQKPIEAADPNAVKKKPSPKSQNDIIKRVQKDSKEKGSEEEPKLKRCLGEAFGKIDMNSDEAKKLLKAKSAHVGQVKAAEEEREDKYFTQLVKKEQMEDKMKSITKIQTKVVICKKCKYTAEGASELCRKENHPLKFTKAWKRFFQCRDCKQRTVIYGENRIPEHPCRTCGATNYEKTSMFKDKQGPKIGGETLLVRGREQEHLNGLNTGDNAVTLNWLGDKD